MELSAICYDSVLENMTLWLVHLPKTWSHGLKGYFRSLFVRKTECFDKELTLSFTGNIVCVFFKGFSVLISFQPFKMNKSIPILLSCEKMCTEKWTSVTLSILY